MTDSSVMRQKKWLGIFITTLGAFIMGAGVNFVFVPMDMVVGGVSGMAIIVKELTGGFVEGGVPVWLTTAVINIPLFVLAYRTKGKEYVKRALFAAIVFNIALYVLPTVNIIEQDTLLASLVGGILTGAGLGFVFRNGASTGGTDLLGAILNYYFPHYSVATMLLIVDSTIITLGAFIFGVNSALYAIIAAYITSKVLDSMLEGVKFGKLAYIISDDPNQVATMVMNEVKRGVTFIEAQGGYTKEDRKMVMCVVSKKQIVKLKETIAKIDPNAFLIISDVREVFGEGFIENSH